MTHQDALQIVNVKFQSDPYAVRGAVADVLTGLKSLPLDGDELGTIELVLVEALNNVVEHAYPEGGPMGPVQIACSRIDSGLHFRVLDQGKPMPDGELPVGQQPSVDVDMYDLPEGGFGWFLIQDLAKDVHYSRVDDTNILDLRVALAFKD